jgi:mono/diheme cytochrome c family protein
MLSESRNSVSRSIKARLAEWHPWPVWALLLILVLLVVLARAAAAERASSKIIAEGRQDFEEYCVACHGSDATGAGELAAKLVKPPKDLTTIAARNGGAFPFWRVFEIVAGETDVAGHETLQMPKYLEHMRSQDHKPGYLPAHVRVLELTHYLESIQKK